MSECTVIWRSDLAVSGLYSSWKGLLAKAPNAEVMGPRCEGVAVWGGAGPDAPPSCCSMVCTYTFFCITTIATIGLKFRDPVTCFLVHDEQQLHSVRGSFPGRTSEVLLISLNLCNAGIQM
jgi:hypothetical protein